MRAKGQHQGRIQDFFFAGVGGGGHHFELTSDKHFPAERANKGEKLTSKQLL